MIDVYPEGRRATRAAVLTPHGVFVLRLSVDEDVIVEAPTEVDREIIEGDLRINSASFLADDVLHAAERVRDLYGGELGAVEWEEEAPLPPGAVE